MLDALRPVHPPNGTTPSLNGMLTGQDVLVRNKANGWLEGSASALSGERQSVLTFREEAVNVFIWRATKFE